MKCLYTPDEILGISIENGQKKIQKPLVAKLILGFTGSAMISLDYSAYMRVSAPTPADLAGVQALVGAMVFPIGLIVTLMAGDELTTGNMVTVSMAWFIKKISFRELLVNWVTTTLASMIGALFVVYFFGHHLGLTSSGTYLNQVLSLVEHRVVATWPQAITSGIGRDWFVGLALWLCYGTRDTVGGLLGIWFPVMIFVTIGFQYNVAGTFIILATTFKGGVQWEDFFRSLIFIHLGDIIGSATFVSSFYYLSYREH